jgi:hypothetical protein
VIVRPSFVFTTPEKNPRTECCCHPVFFMIAAMVVPLVFSSIARTSACLESVRAPDCLPVGEGREFPTFPCEDACEDGAFFLPSLPTGESVMPLTPMAASPDLVIRSACGPSSSRRQDGISAVALISSSIPPSSKSLTGLPAFGFRFAGMTTSPSSRREADDKMIN